MKLIEYKELSSDSTRCYTEIIVEEKNNLFFQTNKTRKVYFAIREMISDKVAFCSYDEDNNIYQLWRHSRSNSNRQLENKKNYSKYIKI